MYTDPDEILKFKIGNHVRFSVMANGCINGIYKILDIKDIDDKRKAQVLLEEINPSNKYFSYEGWNRIYNPYPLTREEWYLNIISLDSNNLYNDPRRDWECQ